MKHAFSLVELSVVLVILGLLTGGILAGQSLIRAAELRAVVTEAQNFRTAITTFREQYSAIPGDMYNATNFWGSAGGSGAIGDGCETATGTGTETCNGNGDGEVLGTGAGEYAEMFTFWQHLSNAGLIEGRYTGITGPGGTNDAERGINVPNSKVSNAGWQATSLGNRPAGSAQLFAADYGNVIRIGAETATGGMGDPILLPEEAWSVDTKLDDGLAYSGAVISSRDDSCSLATSATDQVSYNLTFTNAACVLFFIKSF